MKSRHDDPVIDELTRARVQLLLKQPLFGHIILHLELKEVRWCPTAATDGKFFYYNREFIKSLTRGELVFLSGHEVAHCIFRHIFRCGKRNKDLFNMAADYLANHMLIQSGIGTAPKGALYRPEYSSDDFTVEELYALLEKQMVTIQLPLDMHLDGDGSEADDEDGPPVYTEEEIQAIEDNIRSALVHGVQQQESSAPGSTPAGILRLVERLLRPKINWRQMLDSVLRSTIRYDYTYTRMSRRFWSGGLVLPGPDVMERVEAVACLDGSGSTTQEMITDFLSECQGIMGTFRDFKLTVMTFDTEVYNVVEFTPDNAGDINRYNFHGGGGTAPSCCWRYMSDNGILPDQLLIFTDGEVGSDWGEEDFCDTLFIIHSNPRIDAPYGRTTHYEAREGSSPLGDA